MMPTNSGKSLPLQRLAGYVAEGRPKKIGRTGWIVFAAVLLLGALPSLWAPFDGDQALFFVTGQKILAGDVLYRDVVDLKPPLIYFIYAGAIALFGESMLAVRIVELLVHFGVIWILAGTVRKVSGNDMWAVLAALCYAALYFGLPFYSRGQVEGFANLPIVLMVALLADRATVGRDRTMILTGVLIGVLLLLKTSFLVLLPTVIILLLFNQEFRVARLIRQMFMMGAGMLLPLFLVFLYLWQGGALGDFGLVQEFTSGYAAVQWATPLASLSEAVRQIPWYFSTTYSALLAVLTVAGIYFFLTSGSGQVTVEEGREHGGAVVLLQFSILLFLVLLATVAIEAKYLTWHFNRLFLPGALLASSGAVLVLRKICSVRPNRFVLVMGAACLVPLLLLSPLVRYGWNSRASLINAADGIEAFNSAQGMDGDGFDLAELKKIGDFLRENKKPGEAIFVASGWGGAIHFFAGDVPDFKVYQSGFLIAPYAPDKWRQDTREYLLDRTPQFIVAMHDAMPHITGEETTSLEMLRALPGVDSLLDNEYRVVLETPMALVYQRTGR